MKGGLRRFRAACNSVLVWARHCCHASSDYRDWSRGVFVVRGGGCGMTFAFLRLLMLWVWKEEVGFGVNDVGPRCVGDCEGLRR